MSEEGLFEDELLQDDAVELKVEESEPIEEIAPEPEAEPVPEPEPEPEPEKPKKKKRVISEETKARLRENLKKGRETSLANRKKKAKLKQIEKEEKQAVEDEKIFENLKRKLKPKELEDENAKLRAELAELKAAREEKKKVVIKEPEPVKQAEPEPVKETPKKPVRKVMTARQRRDMMRGL